MSSLSEIADAMWTAVSDGSLERAGAFGAEAAVRGIGRLRTKLRDHRIRKGQSERPESREELYLSLLELLTADAEARSLVALITANQSVVNTFHGSVRVDRGTIGIHNGTAGR
ncbi:hypothetical protein [Nonomuraea sp. NPDC049141]|uniref:hypothetical protein n=1 Tax=unclassified Nonomuraea TaxID=2593643 RepID=UPI00340A84CA